MTHGIKLLIFNCYYTSYRTWSCRKCACFCVQLITAVESCALLRSRIPRYGDFCYFPVQRGSTKRFVRICKIYLAISRLAHLVVNNYAGADSWLEVKQKIHDACFGCCHQTALRQGLAAIVTVLVKNYCRSTVSGVSITCLYTVVACFTLTMYNGCTVQWYSLLT